MFIMFPVKNLLSLTLKKSWGYFIIGKVLHMGHSYEICWIEFLAGGPHGPELHPDGAQFWDLKKNTSPLWAWCPHS